MRTFIVYSYNKKSRPRGTATKPSVHQSIRLIVSLGGLSLLNYRNPEYFDNGQCRPIVHVDGRTDPVL